MIRGEAQNLDYHAEADQTKQGKSWDWDHGEPCCSPSLVHPATGLSNCSGSHTQPHREFADCHLRLLFVIRGSWSATYDFETPADVDRS